MLPSAPQVSIIIVSYNTRDLLADCLRSLARGTGEISFETIVVDNASADGSADLVAKLFPEVMLVKSPQNVGFAAANNLAAEKATGEFLFFLNPDTLLTPQALPSLVTFLQDHPQAAAVGAGLTFPQGRSQPSSFRFPSLFREFWNFLPELKWLLRVRSLGRFLVSGLRLKSSNWSQTTEPREVDSVNGAAFIVRAKAFREVQGFDSAFFLYHEEMDLCTRLRRNSHQIWILPTAQVIHFDAQASGYKTHRFPTSPVLEWRILGMDLLWQKHKSRVQHSLWRKQGRGLLGLRIILMSICRMLANAAQRHSYRERIDKLINLRKKLK